MRRLASIGLCLVLITACGADEGDDSATAATAAKSDTTLFVAQPIGAQAVLEFVRTTPWQNQGHDARVGDKESMATGSCIPKPELHCIIQLIPTVRAVSGDDAIGLCDAVRLWALQRQELVEVSVLGFNTPVEATGTDQQACTVPEE